MTTERSSSPHHAGARGLNAGASVGEATVVGPRDTISHEVPDRMTGTIYGRRAWSSGDAIEQAYYGLGRSCTSGSVASGSGGDGGISAAGTPAARRSAWSRSTWAWKASVVCW